MRRLSLLIAALALLGPLATSGTGQAGGRLSLNVTGVYVFLPYEDGEETPRKVFALRAGERYRFQVDYEVGGAARIGTGHTFTYSDAVTGERLKTSVKRFPLAGAGEFNESLTFTIPSSWAGGVYRMGWSLHARSPGLRTIVVRGARTFLVLPAPEGPA